MTSPPLVYVSRRLGRAADISRLLERGGCEIRLGPPAADPKVTTRFAADEIARYFRDADALVVGSGEAISREVIAGAPRVKTICCYYIGTEAIDLDACTAAGVIVGYGAVPDNYLGVAEAIVMLSTALLKEVPAKHAALRGGGWGVADAGRMVAGSTIGMIGLGNVGRALARRLAGWDCRLLCYDPYVQPADAAWQDRRAAECCELHPRPEFAVHIDAANGDATMDSLKTLAPNCPTTSPATEKHLNWP